MKKLMKKSQWTLLAKAVKIGITAIIFLFLQFSVSAQQLEPVKKIYSFETINRVGHKELYNLYFIISAKIKVIKGKKYNFFTFSNNLNETSGYIRYDSSKKVVKYIDRNYRNPYGHCENAREEQTLFPFYNDSVEVCSIQSIGSKVTIVSRLSEHSDTINMKVYPNAYFYDANYVNELNFYNHLYPENIIVMDIRSRKDVTLFAKDF